MKTLSWVVLSGLGGLLGPSRAFLGWSWEAPGAPWEAPGAPRGDPKSIKKVDPKLDSKTGRIATEKNGPNITPADVSEVDRAQRESDAITQKSYQNRYRYD